MATNSSTPCSDDYRGQIVDRFNLFVGLQDTDAARVIFAGSPFVWAEVGFENLVRDAGHPLEKLLAQDLHYPTVSIKIDHHRPLTLGMPVEVVSWVAAVGRRSVRTVTEVHDASGAAAVTITRTNVAVSRAGLDVQAEQWLRELAAPRESPNLVDLQAVPHSTAWRQTRPAP